MSALFTLAFSAHAQNVPTPPSLATLIKNGLMTGVQDRGKVRILEVRLFPQVIAMSNAELEEKLSAKEPFPVGIIETKEHGRLRVSCVSDTCTASAGNVSLTLHLVREAPPQDKPTAGARRKPGA